MSNSFDQYIRIYSLQRKKLALDYTSIDDSWLYKSCSSQTIFGNNIYKLIVRLHNLDKWMVNLGQDIDNLIKILREEMRTINVRPIEIVVLPRVVLISKCEVILPPLTFVSHTQHYSTNGSIYFEYEPSNLLVDSH